MSATRFIPSAALTAVLHARMVPKMRHPRAHKFESSSALALTHVSPVARFFSWTRFIQSPIAEAAAMTPAVILAAELERQSRWQNWLSLSAQGVPLDQARRPGQFAPLL
ncbi:hypothetical protein BC828DRAFT_439813 [Blastocladiella britannica]|nr:hypothetical protein BC828DRAFT_439813 [Blastocladiella britannica]